MLAAGKIALATNMGDTFLYEREGVAGGGGQSQGCAGSMSRWLLLAHGKFYLSRCIGSGGWIFAGRSPICFLAERSFGILFPLVLPFSCFTYVP